MRYFIGYLGSNEIQKYYENLTTELHEKFGIDDLSLRVPAHFTLKYPFETSDIFHVENHIEKFIENISPIKFVIDGFGRFDDNNKTIFLSPVRTDLLGAFVEDCITQLGELNDEQYFDPKTFHLHMSVARRLSDDLSEQILNYLTLLPQPRFELHFNNLTLFEFNNDKWKIKRTFILK